MRQNKRTANQDRNQRRDGSQPKMGGLVQRNISSEAILEWIGGLKMVTQVTTSAI